MKIFLLTVVCIVIAFGVVCVDGIIYKFLSIECCDQNKDIFETERCTVNGSVGTVITNLKESLYKINVGWRLDVFKCVFICSWTSLQVLVGLYRHEANKYRQIFKLSKIEWCSFISGSVKSNYMIKFVINTIRESTGKQLFHRCPFQGRIAAMNLTLRNDKLFSIYPRGQYRLSVKMSDGDNREMFFVALEFDLISVDWDLLRYEEVMNIFLKQF